MGNTDTFYKWLKKLPYSEIAKSTNMNLNKMGCVFKKKSQNVPKNSKVF